MTEPRSMNVIACMLLTFICMLASLPEAFSDVFIPQRYTDSNGLASSRVYHTFQDSKGYIWFATENGVNRFDGKEFDLYTTDDGLADNEILKIAEDRKGRIWFLSLNGKLSYFQAGKFYNPANSAVLAKAFSKGSFINFLEDSKGNLWFSTNQNALIKIGKRNHIVYYSSYKYSLANCTLREDGKGRVLAISTRYAFQLDDDQIRRINLKYYPVSARSFLDDTSIHYLCAAGISDIEGKVRPVPRALISRKPELLMLDSKRNIWAGSPGGLFLYKYHAVEKQISSLIPDVQISHIMEDDQANIWIATIGDGVYFLPFNHANSSNVSQSDGLSAASVTAIGKYGKALLLGLRNGDVFGYSPDMAPRLLYKARVPHNSLRQITFDSNSGKVWYALEDKILSYSRSKGVSTEFDPGPGMSIKSFSLGPQGELAIAHASGVYLLTSDLDNSKLNNDPCMHERAFSVFYDSRGRLWYSNVKGLQYLYKGRLVCLHDRAHLLRERITDIAELPDGTLICLTYGSGVFLMKEGKVFRRIGIQQGLASNICKKVFSRGYDVWIATARGISHINFAARPYQIQSFNVQDGLISDEVNDIYAEARKIYIATDRGLTVFNAEKAETKKSPPLYLLDVKVNKSHVRVDSLHELKHFQNMLTFSYIALDYANPGFVSYRYRLHKQSRWVETQSNAIVFAALEPGEYQLELSARSLYSDWSTPVLIDFTIRPPFWNLWWFICIEIFAFGFLVYLIVRNYFRKKQHREQDRLINQTRMLALEQKALQAMMNPHFIFNVMNSIQYFINTRDNTMANQVLTGFARLIRKNLEICNKSYISLEEELEYLNLYLRLEKLRFGEKLSYAIEVDPALERALIAIPSMLLQPYVENAIWHGIMPKEEPGKILIEINKLGDQIIVCIIDDGVGIGNTTKSGGEHISRGMQLTAQRISLINKHQGINMQISVVEQPLGGTKVELSMPVLPFTN